MTLANVLLVDDEVPFLETMVKRLTKRDVKTSTALTGQEALDRLAKDGGTEVVILDVKMPGMDGLETLREIKKRFPLVEVITLTGHATVESAIEGMKWGALDYLMKPCDMDLLLGKVKEASAKKRRQENKVIEARMKEITSRIA